MTKYLFIQSALILFNFISCYFSQQYSQEFWEVLYQYPNLEMALLGSIVQNDYKNFHILCENEPLSAAIHQSLRLEMYPDVFDQYGPFMYCREDADEQYDKYQRFLSSRNYALHYSNSQSIGDRWIKLPSFNASHARRSLILEPVPLFMTYYKTDRQKELLQQFREEQGKYISFIFYRYDQFGDPDNIKLLVYNFLKASTDTYFQTQLIAQTFTDIETWRQNDLKLDQVTTLLGEGYSQMYKSGSITQGQAHFILLDAVAQASPTRTDFWVVISILIKSGIQLDSEYMCSIFKKFQTNVNGYVRGNTYSHNRELSKVMSPYFVLDEYGMVTQYQIEKFLEWSYNLIYERHFAITLLQNGDFMTKFPHLFGRQSEQFKQFSEDDYQNIMFFAVSLLTPKLEKYSHYGHEILVKIKNIVQFEKKLQTVFEILKTILQSELTQRNPQVRTLIQKTILAFIIQLKVIDGSPKEKLTDSASHKNGQLTIQMIQDKVLIMDDIIEYEITRVDGPIIDDGRFFNNLEKERWLRLNDFDPNQIERFDSLLKEQATRNENGEFKDVLNFKLIEGLFKRGYKLQDPTRYLLACLRKKMHRLFDMIMNYQRITKEQRKYMRQFAASYPSYLALHRDRSWRRMAYLLFKKLFKRKKINN